MVNFVKRPVLVFASVLVGAVLLLMVPISTTSHNTLNPLQVHYYSLRAEYGAESALIPLCYHYVFGEKKDIDRATYWVDKLSTCDKERYTSRVQVFRLGIEHMKRQKLGQEEDRTHAPTNSIGSSRDPDLSIDAL